MVFRRLKNLLHGVMRRIKGHGRDHAQRHSDGEHREDDGSAYDDGERRHYLYSDDETDNEHEEEQGLGHGEQEPEDEYEQLLDEGQLYENNDAPAGEHDYKHELPPADKSKGEREEHEPAPVEKPEEYQYDIPAPVDKLDYERQYDVPPPVKEPVEFPEDEQEDELPGQEQPQEKEKDYPEKYTDNGHKLIEYDHQDAGVIGDTRGDEQDHHGAWENQPVGHDTPAEGHEQNHIVDNSPIAPPATPVGHEPKRHDQKHVVENDAPSTTPPSPSLPPKSPVESPEGHGEEQENENANADPCEDEKSDSENTDCKQDDDDDDDQKHEADNTDGHDAAQDNGTDTDAENAGGSTPSNENPSITDPNPYTHGMKSHGQRGDPIRDDYWDRDAEAVEKPPPEIGGPSRQPPDAAPARSHKNNQGSTLAPPQQDRDDKNSNNAPPQSHRGSTDEEPAAPSQRQISRSASVGEPQSSSFQGWHTIISATVSASLASSSSSSFSSALVPSSLQSFVISASSSFSPASEPASASSLALASTGSVPGSSLLSTRATTLKPSISITAGPSEMTHGQHHNSTFRFVSHGGQSTIGNGSTTSRLSMGQHKTISGGNSQAHHHTQYHNVSSKSVIPTASASATGNRDKIPYKLPETDAASHEDNSSGLTQTNKTVIGSVVGGVFALGFVVLALWFMKRRGGSKKRGLLQGVDDSDDEEDDLQQQQNRWYGPATRDPNDQSHHQEGESRSTMNKLRQLFIQGSSAPSPPPPRTIRRTSTNDSMAEVAAAAAVSRMSSRIEPMYTQPTTLTRSQPFVSPHHDQVESDHGFGSFSGAYYDEDEEGDDTTGYTDYYYDANDHAAATRQPPSSLAQARQHLDDDGENPFTNAAAVGGGNSQANDYSEYNVYYAQPKGNITSRFTESGSL